MSTSLATTVIQLLSEKGWMIRCAESCTAGLITAELTSVSGSSAVVDRGFVTYSNQAKKQMLAVKEDTLLTYGAVSAETAYEMVIGALGQNQQPADEKAPDTPHNIAAISVTGIAGPNGGTDDKPVGTVWIGTTLPGQEPLVKGYLFHGTRDDVRQQTVTASLRQLISCL